MERDRKDTSTIQLRGWTGGTLSHFPPHCLPSPIPHHIASIISLNYFSYPTTLSPSFDPLLPVPGPRLQAPTLSSHRSHSSSPSSHLSCPTSHNWPFCLQIETSLHVCGASSEHNVVLNTNEWVTKKETNSILWSSSN